MRKTLATCIAAAVGLAVGLVVWMGALNQRDSADRVAAEISPEPWAEVFPAQHRSFVRTALDYGRTPFGGSTPYDKLEANPFRRRAWAGHAFELEYQAARGHHWAQLDQQQSRRSLEREQPAACAHCHAAEAPRLVQELGWEEFHKLSYNEIRDQLHHGSSCLDCHAPGTMDLRISRPAFARALERRGIDWTQASRQEMRSFVCAQCHSEYYFRGPTRELVLPWDEGLRVEEIERYYDDADFYDWLHGETGAPMVKVQHPEFEFYSTSVHHANGVSCADCHMPRDHEAAGLVTDHWIRSPLTNLQNACMDCHDSTTEELLGRTVGIQQRTTELLGVTEQALADLMNAIVAARERGVGDEALQSALRAHRSAQLRWDFVDAENSTGFHSPMEAVRILTQAIEIARQGERDAGSAATAK